MEKLREKNEQEEEGRERPCNREGGGFFSLRSPRVYPRPGVAGQLGWEHQAAGSTSGSLSQESPEPRQPQRLPGLQREQLPASFLLQGTLLAFLVSESLRSLSVSGSSAGS